MFLYLLFEDCEDISSIKMDWWMSLKIIVFIKVDVLVYWIWGVFKIIMKINKGV